MRAYIKKHPLVILFILGLLVRLALLFADFSFDVNNHMAWAKDIWRFGLSSFYERPSTEIYATLYPNYPPVALFIFSLLFPLQSLVFKIAWWLHLNLFFPGKLIFFIQSRVFLAGTFKLASVAADLGIAALTYRITKKLLIPSLVLFNPAFFYNSAYWGQIDAIPLFFALASFYFLLFTKRRIVSGTLLTLGLLTKPTILVFLPVYLLFFLKKNSFICFLKTFLVSVFIFWIFFLPFFKNGNVLSFPFITYTNKILATQSLPYVTNGAFNFWVLVTQYKGIKDVVPFLFGLSYRIWSYLAVGIFFIFILSYFLRKKDWVTSFIYAAFFCAFTSFLFLTKMHERYSMLPLPFLLIASVKKPFLTRWFVILSLVSFLNLYHSWPVPSIKILQIVVNYMPVNIFLSSLNIFVLLYLFSRIMVSKNER